MVATSADAHGQLRYTRTHGLGHVSWTQKWPITLFKNSRSVFQSSLFSPIQSGHGSCRKARRICLTLPIHPGVSINAKGSPRTHMERPRHHAMSDEYKPHLRHGLAHTIHSTVHPTHAPLTSHQQLSRFPNLNWLTLLVIIVLLPFPAHTRVYSGN